MYIGDFNVPCEKAPTPIPLLYQSGYLSIDYYDKEEDSYFLHFPNLEVRQGMIDGMTHYLMDTDDLERNSTIRAMSRAFKRGDLLLELKVDDTVDNALAQIDNKGYAIPYEADGRKVTKCGVSISSEARTITHWRVVDEEGNIADEQKFS